MRFVEAPDLRLTVARLAPAAHVATIAGELDAYTAPILGRRLRPLVEDDGALLIVDLNDVSFVDSTALGVLVGAAKCLQEGGGELVVATSDPRTRRLVELAGIGPVLHLERSLAEAVERVVARQHA